MPRSPLESPLRKRQRLSSPTYDDQVEDLTQEDLAAFDAIEAQLSQDGPSSSFLKPFSFARQFEAKIPAPEKNTKAEWGQSQEPSSSYSSFSAASASIGLQDDPDNPFSHGFSSAAKLPMAAFAPATIAFASASKLVQEGNFDFEQSPPPEDPPEPDYDAWFKPAPIEATPAFVVPVFSAASAMTGFTKASTKGIIMPSKEALALAKAKMELWQQDENAKPGFNSDENAGLAGPSTFKPATMLGFKSASESFESPHRTTFQTVSNTLNLNTPVTPAPAGFSRPSAGHTDAVPSPSAQYRPKQFKPPSKVGSPLNPNKPTPSSGFVSAATQHPHPLSAPPINAFSVASGSFNTPLSAKAHTSLPRKTPAPFRTPFKPGMGPADSGRPSLGQSSNPRAPLPVSTIPMTVRSVGKEKAAESWLTGERAPWQPKRKAFFSLAPPPDRKTLASSGLCPQEHSSAELEDFGINVSMLKQITPQTAQYYSFHTTSSMPMPTYSAPSAVLGPTEALKELLDRGCTLATKPWVDNHWSLILWKLAGMVNLDPMKESNVDEKRWCWAEVIRQLLYRYERELNSGIRPPLRKIANQDAPSEFPMVLCVSDILWSGGGVTDDGLKIEPHPELELTDGWYRLRAQVDLPMARAVRRDVIRVGRKLGFAGAKLHTERKDASEVLDAYDSTKLILYGNSSHLMPWHAKLGFTTGPCISTLNHLSPDGGVVSALDFVITKVHDIAFLEFLVDEEGNKDRRGPWNEQEEARQDEEWKKRYEMEASKLRAEYDKKDARYEGYIERLERKAGHSFRPGENDYAPDTIDSLYDTLEYPDSAAKTIAEISTVEAGWLALHIRKQNEAARELIGEEIAKELKTTCPQRDVRAFRILKVQDALTLRRPANRTAVLTVWDVLALQLDEGNNKPGGGFDVGQRYMATNLMPQQQSAWMDCEPGSEVYLCTRRDTRWRRIRGAV